MNNTKKIAIITGANGGIGMNYSRDMMAKGYHVVMACRSENLGKSAVEQLTQESAAGSAELMLVDMGDLCSIEAFATAISEKHQHIDVLIHNAGVYFFDKERKESKDGIELNLALHVIGPYALTSWLFPLLKNSSDARVITVSSTEHRGSPIDFNDAQMESDFAKKGNSVAYSRSKWAGLALMFELHCRLNSANINIKALAAHPGLSITGIQHKGNPNAIHKAAIWVVGKILAGEPKDAAKPLVMASTIGESGEFFGPTGPKEMKGPPGKVQPDETTKDRATGAKIWALAEQLTGLKMLD